MEKRLMMLLVGLFLSLGMALAQTHVSGTVTSADNGEPVIGASVIVVGTKTGAVTDIDGNFSFEAPVGSTLRITYLGMQDKEVKAGSNLRIKLENDDKTLNEVVVTAMGISRQSKTLGYSATTVDKDELMQGHVTDVTNALAGKVAGLTVNGTSGDPGGASSVVIRGVSSINGNNQPLYVVDGVPLSQSTFSDTDISGSKFETGHAGAMGGISNLNTNDIENMTILKGAAATALYGSRAANGVIVITTKSGKKGQAKNYSITYNGGVQWSTVANLPDMQNKYGQGWNGKQTYIENGSWGAEFDGSQQVFGPIYYNSQLIHSYSAAKNNLKDFFETGVNTNHSVALSGVSTDNKMTYYFSYGYAYDNGIIPSNKDKYDRNTVAFRGSYEPTDWFKLSSSVNFATSSTDMVSSYQGASFIDGLYELPRDMSLVDHKDLSNPFNTPRAWLTPYGITNPYWAIENNYNRNNGKQINGKVQADIKPIKQLTLTYRYGFDYTDYDLKMGVPQIALGDSDNPDPMITDDKGYAPYHMNQTGAVYSEFKRKYEINHDFLATFNDKYLEDKLDVSVIAGANINERYYTSMTGETDDLTFESGFWNLSNGSTKTTLEEYQQKRRLVGLLGEATLGWDDMLFLDLSARNDWSSTLPSNNNNYFYGGATLSWIFTNLLPSNKVLNFGKLRLSYGKTGNDASPYLTSLNYVQGNSNGIYGSDIAKFPMNGTNAFRASATIGSSDLKPEMTTEFETGFNLAFLQNKINVDFTFYNRVTKDQIFTLPVDPATGFYYMVTNFGEVRNRGIELLVNTTPFKSKDWQWDLGFNFSKNWNKVLSLPESLEGGRSVINSFSTSKDAVYMYAVEGKPIGELYTYLPTYTEDGKQIVDQNGQPVLTSEVQDTGKSVNNDWTAGVTTSLTWKSLTLSAALDIRQGGYMFSRTKNLMQFTGNGTITTYNDRNPFIVPNSVVATTDASGKTVYVENTTPLYLSNGSFQTYMNDYGYGQGGEALLMDRSYVKLRNVTLSWNLPRNWVSKLYLSSAQLSVFCNNLITWTASDNYYIDPEVSSYGNDLNGMFGEIYSNPGRRTYGFNVSVQF